MYSFLLDVNECANLASRHRRSLPESEVRKDDKETGTGSGRQKRWIGYGQSTISPSPVSMTASLSVNATPGNVVLCSKVHSSN